MKRRNAEAQWKGNLQSGNGYITFGEKPTRLPYSFNSRFEEGEGSNPEELMGSALAGCYAMALAHELSGQGAEVSEINTRAEVRLKKTSDGFEIPAIGLTTMADVSGIDKDRFVEIARTVSRECPVAKALKAVEISVEATLKSE